MSLELKETIEIFVAGISLLICLVLLVSFVIITNKLREQRKEIRIKNGHINRLTSELKTDNYLITEYRKYSIKDRNEIDLLNSKLNKCEFVMAVSDDISAELVKENKDLLDKVELLKAKLNHKKRPTK